MTTSTNNAEISHDTAPREPRQLNRRQILLGALVVGFGGGLCAAAYYGLLIACKYLLWHNAVGFIQAHVASLFAHWFVLPMVTTLGGFLVGVALAWMGTPGEIAAVVDNIHLNEGRLDIRQTPAMTVISLISICFGGSAGPEAPLVQITGSLGSWLGDKLRLRGEQVRTFTFCGMGAALGAFFGAPLGGALFALEIPHRRGLEYYEALAPAVAAALASLLVFSAIVRYEGPIYLFGPPPPLSTLTLLEALALGVLGAAIAAVFVLQFRLVGLLAERLHGHKILLASMGGLCIGLIAKVFPLTLFWGEYQIIDIIHGQHSIGPFAMAHATLWTFVFALALLALAKMVAVSCTLHSGFRGGFIFPLFFIGAAIGLAVSRIFPEVPVSVGALCLMAAVNVAVTKTPISTTVILTELSGTSMLPVIAMASFASFLISTRLTLIHTQRSRDTGNV